MKYIDVEWLHANTGSPIRLVSEIGRNGFERRKIEFWSDGRVGYASALGASGDTVLGESPVPAIEKINAQTEFRAKDIDASAFQELWNRHVDGRVHRIECSITFLAASEGGRPSALPAGALSGNTYRPHLVIGDPTQRQAIVASGNQLTEEYIGIAFHDGPATPTVGTEMIVELTLAYFPHPSFSQTLHSPFGRVQRSLATGEYVAGSSETSPQRYREAV